MEDDFKDLQALLRLKKYEAPPAEYFEDFLHEFHRRQRAELLRRPIWRLALDRLEGAWPTFGPARHAYLGSCALAVTAAALASGHILLGHPHGARHAEVAFVEPHAGTVALNKSVFPRLSLHGDRASRLPELNFDQQPHKEYTAAVRTARPRYVLDAQPVSYEQPSSF